MASIILQHKCERRNGTGELILGQDVIPMPCPDCGGVGKMSFLESEDLEERISGIENKLNDIFDKCNDIFEQITE